MLLDVGIEASLDSGRAGRDNLIDFPALQFECFVIFLSGPHNTGMEIDHTYMSCCSGFPQVCIRLSHISFRAFGKRAVLVLSDSNSEEWEKNWKH